MNEDNREKPFKNKVPQKDLQTYLILSATNYCRKIILNKIIIKNKKIEVFNVNFKLNSREKLGSKIYIRFL